METEYYCNRYFQSWMITCSGMTQTDDKNPLIAVNGDSPHPLNLVEKGYKEER